MTKRIAIIQGHPDPANERFCRVFAQTYAQGARAAGHLVDTIDVATLEFPLLRTRQDYEKGTAPDSIRRAQDILKTADHFLIVFPLWLGDMPALLKGFFEQTLRPGFSYSWDAGGKMPQKLLKGKSARIVVTMGMPAFFYRLYFGAHGLKNLRRNILQFCGVNPVAETIVGLIEQKDGSKRTQWLARAETFGREGT
jgi:putative NADPH-quinone reductase